MTPFTSRPTLPMHARSALLGSGLFACLVAVPAPSAAQEANEARLVGIVVDRLAGVPAVAAQIVIGRTGHSELASRLFGSVAGTLAQASPVPVTIVP